MHPLTGSERARPDIADAFFQYDLAENMKKMIATDVLPMRSVREAHGTYPVLPLKELQKTPTNTAAAPAGYAMQRAPRSAYHRDDLGFTEAPYRTHEHGNEGSVDENEAQHYGSAFEHETVTAEWALHRLMIQREIRTAAALFDVTRFLPTAPASFLNSSQAAGTYRRAEAQNGVVANALPWSDLTGSDPIMDIFVAKYKVFLRCGYYPRDLVVNEETWRHLRLNDKIRNVWMAQGAGMQATQPDMTIAAVAEVLDLDTIHVGRSVMDGNTNNLGSFAGQHVWGNGALLFIRATEAIRSIGLGHTLHWTADGSKNPALVEDYREPQTRSHIVRVRHQDQQLIKYDLVAEFITGTLA